MYQEPWDFTGRDESSFTGDEGGPTTNLFSRYQESVFTSDEGGGEGVRRMAYAPKTAGIARFSLATRGEPRGYLTTFGFLSWRSLRKEISCFTVDRVGETLSALNEMTDLCRNVGLGLPTRTILLG